MKKKILWIHGFCGRPNNENIEYMKALYPQYDIYAIEVDHHAKASMEKINAHIKDNKVDLVAGTSLGGYYAMCAEFGGPKLVVNPVIHPFIELRQFLGRNSYKPGRPDGLGEFEFTQAMLDEFRKLILQPLNKTICHYTAHDKVLGEDIKQKYAETFFFLREIDEKILPGHYLSKKYINEEMGKTLDNFFDELRGIDFKDSYKYDMYFHYGMDYMDVPRELWDTLSVARCGNKDLNKKKVLHDIEATICHIHKGSFKLIGEPFEHRELSQSRVIRLLLDERKRLMWSMFEHTEESFLKLREINKRLLTLTELMKQKLSSLYRLWLETEEGLWKNDCQVVGTITTDCDCQNIEGDETGSMYATMLTMIERYKCNELLRVEFAGTPVRNGKEWFSKFDKERPCWYFFENSKPLGNFLMCQAFENLWKKTLFAPQDILRISTYWCDASVVHQCIVDEDSNII